MSAAWAWLTARRRLTFVAVAITVSAAVLLPAAPAQAGTYDPAPVTNITAVSGNGSLTLSWSAPSTAGTTYSGTQLSITKYEVWLSKPGYNGRAGSCTTTTTSCTISSLENGVEHWVEIKAYNSYYYTSYAIAGPFRPCCSIPTAPTSVAAVAGNGTVSISWAPPANAAATSGSISYSVSSSPTGLACATTGLSCDFSNATNGIAYILSVTASTPAGTSAPATTGPVTPKGVPAAPINVTTTVTDDGTVVVSWRPPPTDGGAPITTFLATATPGGATCLAGTAGTSCRMPNLTDGEVYTFTVAAMNSFGWGPASAPSVPTRPLAAPSAPTAVRATGGRGVVKVTWQPPSSAGGLTITGYRVTAKPGGRTCETRRLSCTVTGLDSGTRYVFSVQAFNGRSWGEPARTRPVLVRAGS